MGLPGFGEWLLILGALLLLFGGKKLPELGGALGESIKNFKKGIKDQDESKKLEAAKKDEDNSTPSNKV